MNFENKNLNLELRNTFLKCWNNEYPSSLGWKFRGMIVFTEESAFLMRNGVVICKLHFSANTQITHASSANSCSLNSDLFFSQQILISGDWVECIGDEFKLDHSPNDKTNKIQLNVQILRLLSPNLIDQGHGSRAKFAARDWEKFLKTVEQFFYDRGFDFIKTPTLVPCPGTEPFLESFKTEFVYGSKRQALYLPTSPELHLKKSLAQGWDKVFEIKPCFRNGELTPIHQPEFYMLEWYRSFSSMTEIQEDVINLVSAVITSENHYLKSQDWKVMSVAELFEKYLHFQLLPHSTAHDLISVAEKHDVEANETMDFDEVFFRLFIEKIEPRLHELGSLFLHSYPPTQAALARLTPEGWGDRFEVYIQGVEIANAFNELNNPIIQRARSQEDLQKKILYGREQIALDEDFFKHLDAGMPPSCGIALGLERLFMVLNGYKNISEFRAFSTESV